MSASHDKLVERLGQAVVAVLSRRQDRFGGEILDCLALDVHPWSGFLNLSMRVTTDSSPRANRRGVCVADWKYSQFAIAHETDPSLAWPEAQDLAAEMQQMFNVSTRIDRDDVAALRFYALCAEAVAQASLWVCLRTFSLTDDFVILVPNVDTPPAAIEIQGPSTQC